MIKLRSQVVVLLTLFVAMAFAEKSASADIVFSGNFNTGSGQIEITDDLVYTMSFAPAARPAWIVFDEIVTSDTNTTQVVGHPNLSVTNSQEGPSTRSFVYRDNHRVNQADLTPNDGYLYVTFGSDPAIAAGNTWTVKAGTYTFDAHAAFNPAYNDGLVFTGDSFLTSATGIKVSNTISTSSVPEPTSFVMFGIGVAGLALRRRKRLAA